MPEGRGITGGRLHLLLVEDNSTEAYLMQELLSGAHGTRFEVEWVDRLDKALVRLEQGGVDLVLLDLSLPDSRSSETFARIARYADRLPILVLTGLDDESLAVETMQQGAQDYLVKGRVDRSALVRAIRYAIERKKTQEQLARFAKELRARSALIQEDLNLAREIQQAFLPQRYPTFPPGVPATQSVLQFAHRYLPTDALGGDFFSVLLLSPAQAGVFISDVMGHGVRASLVTALLRGLVEELGPLADDAGRLLTEINRSLGRVLRQMQRPVFASAFYLVIDIAKRRIQYANAGHPSPLRLRRPDGPIRPFAYHGDEPGPALGLFGDSVYRTWETDLAPGDLLLCFTDGLFETRGLDGVWYGEQKLLSAVQNRLHLPATLLLDELLAEVRQFTTSEQFQDDVCLVTVEFTPDNLTALHQDPC